MNRTSIAIALLLIKCILSQAQNPQTLSFSLKEAQDYALKNNISIQNSRLDVEISKNKMREYTAIGLPQVQGGVSYQHFFDIATMLIPDFLTKAIVGTNIGLGLVDPNDPRVQALLQQASGYLPFQMGSPNNMSWNVQASQLIFSGQYLVGLQAFKELKILASQTHVKNEKDMISNVTQAYYLVLFMQENKAVVDESILTIRQTVKDMEAMAEKGFIEQTSLDQLKLTLSNLENTSNSLLRGMEISYNLMKIQLGLPLDQEIILTDHLTDLFNSVNAATFLSQKFIPENNITYKILNTSEKLAVLNMKKETVSFLPTLNAIYQYQRSAMREKFDFFDASQKWYPTHLIGINFSLPIFSSGSRISRYKQFKLDLEKTKNTKKLAMEGLELEYQQAKTEYSNALEKFMSEKDNKVLAQKIYDNTLIKFRNGLATSMELTQAQTQMINSNGNYFKAIYDFLMAKNKLDKTLSNY